jgi:hypothetical protein
MAGITGQPTGLGLIPGYPGQYGCEYGTLARTGPQPLIDFGWVRTDWPTWRKNNLTAHCTTAVDLPVPAVYCHDSGQLYFPLGGYTWILAERDAQSVPVGYQQMLAVTKLLIAHYRPPARH